MMMETIAAFTEHYACMMYLLSLSDILQKSSKQIKHKLQGLR